MASSSGRSLRSRAVGARLRQARLAAGMSPRTVATRVGVPVGVVGGWERGDTLPTAAQAAAYLTEVGVGAGEFVSVTAELLELAERRRERRRWAAPDPPDGTEPSDADTSSIVEASAFLVPEVVRTAEYARAWLTARGTPTSVVEAEVAARLERQEILHRPRPPTLRVLLGEPAVRPGPDLGRAGPAVLAGQLWHLLELVKLPHVRVQVVPTARLAALLAVGDFQLLESERVPPLVRLDLAAGTTVLDGAGRAAPYRLAAERVGGMALSDQESAALLDRRARDLARD
ncbi:helix-turn-helix domain-containing protein [Actinoalloteichus caeruleus]|uniref:Helix-turn-helix domain-containing protein n=1 Tax=Actinoalloteichus caeruleus DSM 43889 TaxID=1120930 RepID=A0ABT1JNI4_ACTCY|nr:DUF5753 domain-containing protein [Actinoalloteichus caeruleus]MCP2334090.1 Helix-turn-helix domain-containing protein [Actinoalloteichus caeruleus DSM 43889]